MKSFIRNIIISIFLSLLSCAYEVPSPIVSKPDLGEVVNISYSKVALIGYFQSDISIDDCYFEYSSMNDFDVILPVIIYGSLINGKCELVLHSLQPDTIYYFRFVVRKGSLELKSDIEQFRTLQ